MGKSRGQRPREIPQAEIFNLCMLGGSIERRYERLRPELSDLPWGSLATTPLCPALKERGREVWTRLTFLEHRTAAAITATVEAMIAARAPVDLVAIASRFVFDE